MAEHAFERTDGACAGASDGRRMCFEQGKAFVYMPSSDSEFIIIEEPNGVVRKLRLSDRTITRTWPDGRVDQFREGDPEDLKPSYIPSNS